MIVKITALFKADKPSVLVEVKRLPVIGYGWSAFRLAAIIYMVFYKHYGAMKPVQDSNNVYDFILVAYDGTELLGFEVDADSRSIYRDTSPEQDPAFAL